MELETPPPFMGNSILSFHFVFGMTSLRKLRCGCFRKKRGWVCSVYQLSSSFSPTKIVQKGGYSLIRNILGPLIKNSWENVHKRGREVTPLADKKNAGYYLMLSL